MLNDLLGEMAYGGHMVQLTAASVMQTHTNRCNLDGRYHKMGRAPGAEVIPLRGLSLWEHHLVWALLILKTLRKIKGVTPWKRGSSTSVLSWPVEQKTIRLTFALQHILHQQIPADKSGEDMVLRLLSSWSESLASVRIVALVH